MGTMTINGLTVVTSAAAGDMLAIWRTAQGDTRKITKANLIGAVLSGSPVGTFVNNGFTATVPATGTIALRNVAQTFTVAQTFGALLTASAGATIVGTLSVSGQATVSSSTFPPLRAERTTSSTDVVISSADVRLTTDGNMADGFGPLLSFSAQDDAGVSNQLAGVGAARDGADDSGALVFQTRLSGSIGERARVAANGRFGVNRPVPRAQLDVDQDTGNAAIPVLVLDQADVDQHMIEFVTTIGTGNAIEAVGAKTLTTTHFVMVKIPGGLTRWFPIGTIA